MKKVNIFQIEGVEYPAGRRTRVILGDNGALPGELFCQGYVVIYPGGSIPLHEHPTVESYTIIKGRGEMTLNGEVEELVEGDCVFVDKGLEHGLKNNSKEDLHLMFVYAPKVVVDHWAQELSGHLK